MEIAGIGTGTVKGSNLTAHCGLKRLFFCEPKNKMSNRSTVCSYVSSIVSF